MKKKQNDPQRCGLKMIHPKPNMTATQVKLEKLSKSTNQPEKPPHLVINASNALMKINPLSSVKSERDAIFEKTWHKFEITGSDLADTEVVLQRVRESVLPFGLFPLKIHKTEDSISFLSYMCGPAIESLCRKGMIIRSSDPHVPDLHVQIIVGFCDDAELHKHKYFTKLLHERYDSSTKSLDLSNFHNNQDDDNKYRYQLSHNAILHQVFISVKVNMRNVVYISVANNNIFSLSGFEFLYHLKSLYKLDLSQNLIKYVSELKHLKTLQLKELLLNENPLCEKYVHEEAYIKDVQSIIPSLQKLDGARIPRVGLPRAKKNFILFPHNISLADQFVEYYFTLFDSANRKNMGGLYHENALFSLSATSIPGQMSTSTARLTQYMVQSRNLVLLSDYSKSVTKLRQGSQQVLEAVCQLPRTEHDPHSFKVDLIQGNPVVLSVSGVFKEVAKTEVNLIRSFFRVFVLVKTGPKSYQIANETLHITNATTDQAVEAFRYPKSPPKIAVDINESDFKKERMIEFMSELTTMNMKWSRKCLEETNWNIKEALTIFTELYKVDKIPEEAFAKDCTA